MIRFAGGNTCLPMLAGCGGNGSAKSAVGATASATGLISISDKRCGRIAAIEDYHAR